jgi:hypothetical protein
MNNGDGNSITAQFVRIRNNMLNYVKNELKEILGPGLVIHVCNPIYSEGGGKMTEV